jgi:hypothetical protein
MKAREKSIPEVGSITGLRYSLNLYGLDMNLKKTQCEGIRRSRMPSVDLFL